MKVFFISNYGKAFFKREDAVSFLRKEKFNKERLDYLKTAFNLDVSEKHIQEEINQDIDEIEVE